MRNALVAVAVVCSFAISGCGGQARTVTVTTSQTTFATSSSTSSATTSGTSSTPSVPATTTTSTASSSVPSWVLAARKGCPPGEILVTKTSTGQPAPYGNDGCVGSGSYECAPSEPTCDPANAPATTSAPQTTQTQTAPVSCQNAQTFAANISCNDSGRLSMAAEGTGTPDVVCPAGMAVYWRGANAVWCAEPSGPFDSACAPDRVYAGNGDYYLYGPLNPAGLSLPACANDAPARPYHNPAAGIP